MTAELTTPTNGQAPPIQKIPSASVPEAPKAIPPITRKVLAIVVAATAAFSIAGAVALDNTVFVHTGPTGAQGFVGATGAQGAQGIQGVKGQRGRTGKVGATGSTGASGINGVNGSDGTSSVVGVPCSNDPLVALPYC
jgi:hypothetical protein